jgi:hypothetical protein
MDSDGDPARERDKERVHAKVRALLRKAESTTFPAEAEALMAKAQDLLTRHALVDASGLTDTAQGPQVRPVAVRAPYASGRAMVLGAVASANRCTAVWDRQASTVMLVGYPVDLDAVAVLWGSLVAQAEMAVRASAPVTDGGRSRTRSWRTAFWAAFAQRIGQRLSAQDAATVRDHVAASGEAALPVLASRRAEVDAAVRREFPRLATRRSRVSNGDGWVAGQRAADRASLGGSPPVTLPPG